MTTTETELAPEDWLAQQIRQTWPMHKETDDERAGLLKECKAATTHPQAQECIKYLVKGSDEQWRPPPLTIRRVLGAIRQRQREAINDPAGCDVCHATPGRVVVLGFYDGEANHWWDPSHEFPPLAGWYVVGRECGCRCGAGQAFEEANPSGLDGGEAVRLHMAACDEARNRGHADVWGWFRALLKVYGGIGKCLSDSIDAQRRHPREANG